MEQLEHNRESMRSYLRTVNRILTIERDELLDVLDSMEGVYTLNELFAQTRERRVVHTKSTLYRVMHLFINGGLVHEIKRSNEDILYESSKDRKIAHLLCVVCGEIATVDDSRGDNALHQACAARAFTPLSSNHVIKGYCRKCREHKPDA